MKVRWTDRPSNSYKSRVSIHAPLVKVRSAHPGPERRLLQAALRCGLPVSSDEALIIREAELPSGVPDLIAIEPRPDFDPALLRSRRLQLPHLQILHFLNDSGPATPDEIVRLLNHQLKRTAAVLEDLIEANLITRRGSRFASRAVSEVFVAKRIIAVEAKMRAWREALEQAAANFWFASHSYILIPALNCLRLICDEAKKLGVGVLVFDGKETRTALRPRRQSIPASYGSWLINEWALRRLK